MSQVWRTEESSKPGSEEGNCSSYEGLAVLRSKRLEELEDMVNQKFNNIRNLQEQGFEEMNQRILAIGQRIDKHEVAVEKLLVSSRSNLEKTIQDTKQRCMKLKFNSNISVPILTGEQIKGEGVALKGDDKGDAWTAEQFQSKIARDRRGKQSVLAGNLQLELNKGIVSLSDVMFKSSQHYNGGTFKLGAWVVDTFDGSRVKEAKTNSFKVHDYRIKYNQKHYPPSPSDEVWRLVNIAKNGATHKRLKREKVNYVKDFLTRLSKDPQELKRLVRLPEPKWEATVRHAKTCKPDNIVGQVPAPAPGDACNMLVASVHQDKGIPFDGNIMPSMDSPGVLTGLDVSDFPIVDSMEIIFDHPLNIPGQVTNNMICDIDSMTPAFYEDEHLQFVDSSSLGPSTGLHTAVSGFLRHPPRNGRRRWNMLFSVWRWSSSIIKLVARKSKAKEVKGYR
ncbi:calmodulin-binding protein 60 A isoform X3 [Coffea arabica]|uniref:Calmodulin-binding protein 60 A isoform X3 n=1 Tax=Coffea arabica TaxID=13443 RepID=A0ABM4U974_COFAR